MKNFIIILFIIGELGKILFFIKKFYFIIKNILKNKQIIKNIIFRLKLILTKKSKRNLKNIYKKKKFFLQNFKKISKKKKMISIFSLTFYLLFSNTITFCENNHDIHHYIINKEGIFEEITNEQEREKLLNEIEKERLEKEKEDREIYILTFIFLFIFFSIFAFSSIYLFNFIYDFFFGIDFDDDDEDYKNEPLLTEYQKKWVGKEDRLRDRICPFIVSDELKGKEMERLDIVDDLNKKHKAEDDFKIKNSKFNTKFL